MARVISWFSCGAASAVATKLALAEFGAVNIVYTMVREEHKDNMRFLQDCENWFDQEIEILINKTYDGSIYNVFKNHYMNTPYGSPCSRDLKKKLRQRYQQHDDVQILGYTAEEEGRINRFIDGNNEVDLYPILFEKGLTKSDCLIMLDRAGIELPVMYKLGYSNNNCVGCVKGGIGYWNKIRIDFPDEFEKMAKFEREKGYTVLKDKNGPIYLDELDPNRGRFSADQPGDCGIFCLAAESIYKGATND